MSNYGVISGPYFPVFGLNTEIYFVNLRIQSEYRKIQTRNNSVFRHFSCSENFDENTFFKDFFTMSSYSFRIVLCFLKNLILNLSMKNWQNNVLKMSNSAFLWDKNPFGRYQLLFIISYKS